jgi:PRC-barrel domain
MGSTKSVATRRVDKERAVLRSMTDLKGFTIGATDGDIGQVEAFYFDDASFTVRHLVVDTGGWLGGRKVLISPRALRDVDWDGRRINAALTKAQVEKSPNIDTDQPVSRQHEIEYYRYYGYPSYWSGPYLWGGYPFPVMSSDQATLENERRWEWGTEESGDRHLRSSAAVIGYYIAATDGELGHVENFLVDDATWSIRYMVVDTSNWWFGKKVLVSSEWITRVVWNESLLHVDMTREQIKNSPEYDPSAHVQRDYEMKLHDHYGRPGYWSDCRDELTTGRR